MLRWMRRRRKILGRVVPGLMGVVLLVQGATALSQGEGGWPNYWGGLVSPYFALLLGAALLAMAVWRPMLLSKKLRDKRGREVRFPHQDVRKW
jgi:hypothetical protein